MSLVVERPVVQRDIENKIWYSSDGTNTNIGFTKEFLEIVKECWHVTPSAKYSIKEKTPLFTIETNDTLFTVKSPVTGDIISFNDNASNFPDQLTEKDVVCVIGPLNSKKREKPKQILNDRELIIGLSSWTPDIDDGLAAIRQTPATVSTNTFGIYLSETSAFAAPPPQPRVRNQVFHRDSVEQEAQIDHVQWSDDDNEVEAP